MTFWEILLVIGIIVIPLILSIWMTLWTVEKRGRGPKPSSPYRRAEPAQPEKQVESSDRSAG